MVNFIIKRANGIIIPLKWVNNWTPSGGNQTVIQYEAPGTDSGYSIITGRTAWEITLSGVFVGTMSEIQQTRDTLLEIKDKGELITLISPLNNKDTGKYYITNVINTIDAGKQNSSTFTITLSEGRVTNVKKSIINLISFEPIEEFKARLLESQL